MGQRVFRILESRQPEGPSPRHLLPVVSKITHLAPHTLHEGIRPPGEARAGRRGRRSGAAWGTAPCRDQLLVFEKDLRVPLQPASGDLRISHLLSPLPPRPPPTHRPDQPAQQAAGGLAPLRQRPARGGAHFRRLLLHTQSPAGEPGDSHRSCPWAAPGHVGRPRPRGPFSSSRLSTRLGSRMIPLCLHLGEGVLGLAGSRPPSPGRRVPNALASIAYLPGPRPLGR